MQRRRQSNLPVIQRDPLNVVFRELANLERLRPKKEFELPVVFEEGDLVYILIGTGLTE
jgi:hypothetical protein